VLVVKPVIVIGEDAPVAVMPPGNAFAVKPVIAPPPTFVGAVKVIDADVLEGDVAVPIVGALGVCNGKYDAVNMAA
jgi:hypothetical protein